MFFNTFLNMPTVFLPAPCEFEDLKKIGLELIRHMRNWDFEFILRIT